MLVLMLDYVLAGMYIQSFALFCFFRESLGSFH